LKTAQVAVLIFIIILSLALSAVAPAHGAQGTVWARPGGAHPALLPSRAQPPQVSPVYDEQLGMTFDQGFTELDYNVTAVAQSDAQGFGPGYLLNGLTDGGYWYQVGLAFDWPIQSGGYVAGIHFLYEAFNDSGTSIFPAGGGGGLGNFTGPVISGDVVLLRLAFSGGQVDFSAKDWMTGSTASESFPAVGSRFVGLHSSSGANGFFTGLMTEWYHADPYYSDEGEVEYTNPSTQLLSATLWADEFNANTSTSLFGYSQYYAFSNPYQLRVFSLEGATEYGDAYEFITGALGRSLLTLSYAVSGGGTGFLPPVLRYTWNGTQETATLTGTPTSFIADNGSYWQVSTTLPGGSDNERWMTIQQTNGTVSSDVSERLSYFHQYLLAFGYRDEGGGTGYEAPQVNTVEFGSAALVKGNTSDWVDAGSSFSYPSLLQGSTTMQRWASLGYTASVTGATRVSLTYFRQVSLTVSYLIVAGGTPDVPALSGTRFGESFSTPVSNNTGYFLDTNTLWSIDQYLKGSSPLERWVASQPTNGTITEPLPLAVTYRHQYSISTNAVPGAGGSIASTPAAWAVAGSEAQILATPSQGWELNGWAGAGSGAYDGTSATASITVTGPIVENATFYPGLTITAGGGGSVTYSWQGGSGMVDAGSTSVVYLPPGTEVDLTSAPSTSYAFDGWGSGVASTGANISLRVDSPQAVLASFSIDPRILVGGTVALAVTAILIILAARRGWRRRAEAPPAFNSAPSAPLN